jgi:hypothetical protein
MPLPNATSPRNIARRLSTIVCTPITYAAEPWITTSPSKTQNENSGKNGNAPRLLTFNHRCGNNTIQNSGKNGNIARILAQTHSLSTTTRSAGKISLDAHRAIPASIPATFPAKAAMPYVCSSSLAPLRSRHYRQERSASPRIVSPRQYLRQKRQTEIRQYLRQ